MRAILTYHSIDDSGSPISVDPGSFERHLAWLEGSGIRVVALDQILRSTGGDDAVALTFDDGFANFATLAAPGLLGRGWPVTVFVATEAVGRSNAWSGRGDPGVPVAPLLDWAALGRLAERGVAIGSHTKTHAWLTRSTQDELDEELGGSAAAIEAKLGVRPAWLAYPYGAVDARVASAAGRYYEGAVTTEYRLLGRGEAPLRVPRLDAFYFRGSEGLAGWSRPGFRQGVWLRRQARFVRRVLVGTGGGA